MTVLICSVGGTPEPIAKSINEHKPEKVIYVASSNSRPVIRLVEDSLEKPIRGSIIDAYTVTLSNYQNLLECVQDIRSGLVLAHEILQLPPDTELVADITGGTKVMTAALTLVMMEYPNSRFTYTGGKSRTKDGLGIVCDGDEVFMAMDNPWEVMAFKEIQQLVEAFNACQFDTALSLAQDLTKKIPGKGKFYHNLEKLIDGYARWDAFDHQSALNMLKQSIGQLQPFTMQSDGLKIMVQEAENNKDFLGKVQQDATALRAAKHTLSKGCGQAFLEDLVANARRRAKSGRYDDAVARLYSAIEKCAKIKLMAEYGIDNSDVDLSLVPESSHKELNECADSDGKIKIPLQRSFLLLVALGDPLGQAFQENSKELDKQLSTRNMSLLAHGYNPVSKDSYEVLYQMALDFLGVKEETLPVFLTLNWKTLIL